MTSHSSGQTIRSFPRIGGLGAGGEVFEITGRVCDMDLDGIGELGDTAAGCMEQV